MVNKAYHMVASLFATILNREYMTYSMSKEARGRKKLRNQSGITMINEIMEHVHGLICSGANVSIKHGIECKCCYKSMKSNKDCKEIRPTMKVTSTMTFSTEWSKNRQQ